jgi:hypothetical protein
MKANETSVAKLAAMNAGQRTMAMSYPRRGHRSLPEYSSDRAPNMAMGL